MNKNDFIENALKEHARLEGNDDQAFLDDLERKLDDSGVSEEVEQRAETGGRKYLWTAVAATVAVSAIGLSSLLDKKGSEEAQALVLREDISKEIQAKDGRVPVTEGDHRNASLARPIVGGEGQKSDNDSTTDLERFALQTDPSDPVSVVAPVPGAMPSTVESESKPKVDNRVASLDGEFVPGNGLSVEAEGKRMATLSSGQRIEVPASAKSAGYSDVALQTDAALPSVTTSPVRAKRVDEFSSITNGLNLEKNRGYGRGRGVTPFGTTALIDRGHSGDKYDALVETGFLSPLSSPQSTFSTDVDTAAYSNIRRHIMNGQGINPNAVRIEEMINYFDYQYPQPEGDHPFAVHTEVASCPWNPKHRLVRIGLQGKKIDEGERKAANLVFLLDVSGSMNSPDKLPLLVQSFQILLKQLNEEDRVSLVVYAGRQAVLLQPTAIDEDGRTQVAQALNQLSAGGSTAGAAGITTAYDLARKGFIQGGVNRVILATDGDFNVGITDKKELVKLVENQAEGNISLSVLGFGQGNLNDAMMEKITNAGDGNYFYIDSLREGKKVFQQGLTGTIQTIAKDVKIQVEFNPGKVGQYRLIGYANRRLKDEDFKNDNIDAGDIGAGHRVTALYEVVPNDLLAAQDLKYQKVKKELKREIVDSPEMLTVKLRYKQPDGDVSTELSQALTDQGRPWEEASEDFRFSSSVALWGMLLRNSSYSGNGTPQLVNQLALSGQGEDVTGDRTEMLDLVRRWSSRR